MMTPILRVLVALLICLAPLIGWSHDHPRTEIQRLSKQLQTTPNDPVLLVSRAIEHEANNDPEAVIADVLRAEAQGVTPTTRLLLAEAELELGRPDAAKEATHELATSPDAGFGVLSVQARAAARLGLHHEAARWYARALKQDSDIATVLGASENAASLGNTREAARFLDEGIETHQYATVLVERRIQNALDGGEYTLAIRLASTMIERSDIGAQWRIYRAQARERSGDWRGSREDLYAARDAVMEALNHRRSPLLLVLRGKVLLALDADQEAAADFEEAFRRAPEFPAAKVWYLKTRGLL